MGQEDAPEGDGVQTPQVDPVRAAADTRKVNADAAKVEAETQKLADEHEDWVAARDTRARDAAAKSAELELANDEKRLKNLEAQRTAFTDAVPDLSGVKRGETTVTGDAPMLNSLLTSRALGAAAASMAKVIQNTAKAPARVFVTSDEVLVDRLAMYRGVERQIEVLAELVNAVTTRMPPASALETVPIPGAGAVVSGIAAAAGELLPGLLSLLSANRSVTTAEPSLDENVTLTTAAGALLEAEPGLYVYLDKSRLLSGTTDVEQKFVALEDACRALADGIAARQGADDEPTFAWRKDAQATLETAQSALRALTTPAGESTISPLLAAASQAVFAGDNLDFILIVKPAGASTVQLVSDRPLAMKDPVHIRASASIAYTLLGAKDSRVRLAGVRTGESELVGRIGSALALKPS